MFEHSNVGNSFDQEQNLYDILQNICNKPQIPNWPESLTNIKN